MPSNLQATQTGIHIRQFLNGKPDSEKSCSSLIRRKMLEPEYTWTRDWVDEVPIKNGDIPGSYVSLPEGRYLDYKYLKVKIIQNQ